MYDRTNQPHSVIGEHLVVGSQFHRKPKLEVPNCSLIIPQRYKKDYEEVILKGMHAKLRTKEPKPWLPGGQKIKTKSQGGYDRQLKRRARNQSATSSYHTNSRVLNKEHMRDLSRDIERSQHQSAQIINRV